MNRFKHITILLVSLAFSVFTYGQKDKSNQVFEDAEGAYYNEEFVLARDLFQELCFAFPSNSYYKFMLGQCYLELREEYFQAEQLLLEAAKHITGPDTVYYVNYYLGWAYHLNMEFDNAIKYYDKTLLPENFDEEMKIKAVRAIEMCENGKKLIKKPERVTIDNIGKPINSVHDEYAPVISADNQILMFTSRRPGSTGGIVDYSGKYFEDIYFSQLDSSGKWSEPKNIGGPINTGDHESSVGLSVDGENLLMYRFVAKKGDGDLYFAKRKGRKWKKPELLPGRINSRHHETRACLSFDGTIMYFVSSRPGGQGGKDLYRSLLNKDGKWGKPVTLGSIINTKYDEESPFMHPDGKTLYFSSKGHNSMGGYDIFKSEMVNGRFGYPINIGHPINTPTDDIHYVLSANGHTAYYASSIEGGLGEEDIYVVNMPAANIPLTMVRGEVITSDGRPVNVKIKVIDKENENLLKYVYNPNPITGKYLIILPPGKNYDMVVEAEGYHTYVFNVYIPEQDYFYELYQTMYLKTVSAFGDTLAQGLSLTSSFDEVEEEVAKMSEPTQRERDDLLLNIMEDIIETQDSIEFALIEQKLDGTYVPEGEKKTEDGDFFKDEEDDKFDPLLHLVDQIIQSTDTTALKYLDKIAEDGFFEDANKNVVFFDENTENELEPMKVGDDTVYVVPPTVMEAKKKQLEAIDKEETPAEKRKRRRDRKDKIVVAIRNKEEKIDKKPETSNKTILSHKFYFSTNKRMLDQYNLRQLDNIAQTVFDHPYLLVEIDGHTDDQGNNKLNLKLSRKRAQYIARFFKLYEIESSRIKVSAYGEIRPEGDNDSDLGRQLNRRVEIKVINTGNY